jgi:hypothetical protein
MGSSGLLTNGYDNLGETPSGLIDDIRVNPHLLPDGEQQTDIVTAVK